MMNRFTWEPFFEELLSVLCRDFDSKSLATLIHKIFSDAPLKDQYKDGTSGPVKEIDPLTFIGYFNRGLKLDKQIGYCRAIKKELNLKSEVPLDFSGIPKINNQASWFFPYAKEREADTFQRLWQFAKALNSITIEDNNFQSVLDVKGVGLAKLTQLCFICKPKHFLPLDKNTTAYLFSNGLIKDQETWRGYLTFSAYSHVLQTVKEKFPAKSFAEISGQAYDYSNSLRDVEDRGYWVGGAHWKSNDKTVDKTDEFIDQGIWLNGFSADSKDSSLDSVKKVKAGDFIAIKSSSTKGKNHDISFIKVKALGIVKENFADGVRLSVDWRYKGPAFDLDGISYRKTFEQVREKDVSQIFGAILDGSERDLVEFEKVCKLFEPEKVRFYLDSLRSIVQKLKIQSDDQRVVFSCSKNELNFTVGQRYCFVLKEKNEPYFAVTTKHRINESSGEFDGKPLAYYTRFDNIQDLKPHLESMEEKVADELERTKSSGFKRFDNIDFRNDIFQNHSDRNTRDKNMNSKINLPDSKNIIFWGPPGTGKTYQLLQMQNLFKDFSSGKDEIVSWVQELGWWEAIAAALIDMNRSVTVPELMEHEFVQLKVKQQSANKSPKNTVWGQLQLHTVKSSKTVSYERRQEPLVVDKSEDSKWALVGDWELQLEDIAEDVKRIRAGKSETVNERFKVVTFHQSYSYEEFVEGIRPERLPDGTGISYQVKDGVFKLLCQRAVENPDKDYAIFIDEINRGNLSKIFGELITLIEEDKRIGGDHEIYITLPYSGKRFGVPSNLFIIGTMNSVDRSIALVDMALRRRFEFISIRPDSNLVKENVFDGINIRKIFEKLNQKIAVILGTEYQVGHSYFMDKKISSIGTFKKTWFGNILPLLQEYLFDDWDKLEALVGKFVKKTDVTELEKLSLPKTSYGCFIDNTIPDAEFSQLMRSLE